VPAADRPRPNPDRGHLARDVTERRLQEAKIARLPTIQRAVIVGTALSEPRLTAGLIVDGIHVDPVSVRAAFAAKGADRIALVTDAMPTVGTSLDRFDLVGRTIKLVDGRLVTEEGTLAGAHLDMASAVRNAVRLAKVPLEDALRAASLTPARFLGVENERGAIVPGARADLAALTDKLTVAATWIDGEIESYGVP
jgi:N-acetylglucosamine-6-phosphate deacetylase